MIKKLVEPEEETPEKEITKVPEESVESPLDLKTELTKLRNDFEEKFRNEQRINTKKEQEIIRLREQLTKRNEDTDLSKALLGYLAQTQNRSVEDFEDTVRTNQPDLIKQWEQITQKSEEKKKKEEYAQKADNIWERTQKLNLGEDNEDAQEIYDFLTDGKLQRAEIRLKKLETQKTKVESSKEEKKEPTFEERLEEEKRKWMEASGQLTSDLGKPSSSSGKVLSASEVEKMDFQKFVKEFGNYEGFLKALVEGKIRK